VGGRTVNKLTEIKERLEDVQRCLGIEYLRAISTLEKYAEKDIEYLLSLLEEKDIALRFYANENNYFVDDRRPLTYIEKDLGYLARKALNTSSNNEGETI
jgi:hypothetical protein